MGIIINNVSKVLSGRKVLDDINLSLEYGNIYGVHGKNGSGKTMLFRAISGLMIPTSGEIIIDDNRLYKDIRVPKSLGIIIENPSFWDNYTGFENLKTLSLLKGIIDENDIRNTLEKVGLGDAMDLKVKKYSLGMRQRLAFAQAIMEEPDILILDEPMNGLDSEGVELFKNIIIEYKMLGKLVIVASHYEEDIEYLSDYLIEIRQGKVESFVKLKED